MRIIARSAVKLDAPLHIYTPIERSKLEDGDPKDIAGVFIGPDWPSIQKNIQGVQLRITLKPSIVVNPLFKTHRGHGVAELLAEAVVEVDSFSVSDAASYQTLRQRIDRVLLETANRIIDYFRYRLGNALLKRLNLGSISEWIFYDESGAVLYINSGGIVGHHFPGSPGEKLALGSEALRPDDLPHLQDFVDHPVEPSTTLSLQAQARDAVLAKDVNLAVILLAVCAEVAIKTAYFRRDPVVSEAYDYLEEKRQVEVSPIELISQVAKRAFGQSFGDAAPDSFQMIEYIFRCRNKVAHRGQAIYRDHAGKLRKPNEAILVQWFASVDKLLGWLSSQKILSPS